jgi:hypothetical protein
MIVGMARNPYNTLPSRNDLLAARARVARAEREATARANDLRWVMDSMTEELRSQPINAERTARLITAAGDWVRAGCPPKLPPKGSTARLIVISGMLARNEKIPDDE